MYMLILLTCLKVTGQNIIFLSMIIIFYCVASEAFELSLNVFFHVLVLNYQKQSK